ncbi:hypothetical protein GASC598B02_005340, partial [Gilliamella apicola SCGC AB-598-B02]
LPDGMVVLPRFYLVFNVYLPHLINKQVDNNE